MIILYERYIHPGGTFHIPWRRVGEFYSKERIREFIKSKCRTKKFWNYKTEKISYKRKR